MTRGPALNTEAVQRRLVAISERLDELDSSATSQLTVSPKTGSSAQPSNGS